MKRKQEKNLLQRTASSIGARAKQILERYIYFLRRYTTATETPRVDEVGNGVQVKSVGAFMDEIATEYCRKCGTTVYPFSKKYSESASDFFCVKCAERTDREYLAKHTCAICTKRLGNDELKFVLPASRFADPKMSVFERVSCLSCHRKLASRSRDRRDSRHMRVALVTAIRKGIVKRMIIRDMERPLQTPAPE